MTYVYTLFIISFIGFISYRIVKKKSMPSNRYTPYDDIAKGIKRDDIQQENSVQDNKHHIR